MSVAKTEPWSQHEIPPRNSLITTLKFALRIALKSEQKFLLNCAKIRPSKQSAKIDPI